MRSIRKYPKKEKGYRGTAERWGVAKRKVKEERLLLIHGTGKSGTKSFCKMLNSVGISVSHEEVGEQGTVTHFFHSDHRWYPMFPWYKGKAHVGERKSDYRFKHTILLVRNPLKTIASMLSSFDLMDFEFLEDCGVISEKLPSKLCKSMNAYYYMNTIMEKESELIIQIEHYARHWSSFCRVIGMDIAIPNVVVTNRNTGYRTPKSLDWEDLIQCDKQLTKKIKTMARRYGYEV